MPRTTIRSEDVTDAQIKTADMAVDPTNASNLSSGSVPLAQLGNAPATDTTGLEADIALLAFKTQVNGNLARYNLVDQFVDAFEDASGVDAATSTNAVRNIAGKYYQGDSGGVPTATGGTITTSGDYTYHAFTSVGSTNYVNDTTQDVEYLVVAGGGGGGWENYSYGLGGAGGAGGVRHATGYSVPAGTYAVVVGTGGAAGGAGAQGGDGVASSFAYGPIAATGGGGGGGASSAGPNNDGRTGGSGGGGGSGSGGAGNAGSYSPVEGYDGGPTTGGGGGAGGVGYQPTAGIGAEFTNFKAWGTDSSNVASTGANGGWFGGGGGGGRSGGAVVSGGVGGGGDGKVYNTSGTNQAGHTNTGGGGGNGQNGSNTQAGGAGGTGIVLLRRLTASVVPANLTLVSTTSTAQAAPTKGDLVFTYTNGAGTAVLGTNITAEYSADAGSTWTDFGIVAADTQGTTGGHTIVTKNNVTLTSTSGTSMRYRIKTLVQSASLVTRIHAVSLGWS